MARRRRPSEERPPDIEIGATAKAKRIRFTEKPETVVEFSGRSVAETDSGSERRHLPDEVEPNVVYRDVEIGWRSAAWIDDALEEPFEASASSKPKPTGDGQERK